MPLPIVLLPGLDGTGDLFEPLVAKAPESFRPIVVRFPELSAYADLLEEVRRQLPATGNFAVLGDSFSGPLAVAIAREEADRVVAVVLCNSFVAPPATRFLRYLPWSLIFAIPPARWIVRCFFVGTDASPAIVSMARAAIKKTPRRVLAGRMRAVFNLPDADEVPRLRVPVLSLSGTKDLLVPNDALEAWAPDVVRKKIAAPHLLLQAAPEAAWAEISAFFEPLAQ